MPGLGRLSHPKQYLAPGSQGLMGEVSENLHLSPGLALISQVTFNKLLELVILFFKKKWM